MVAPDKLFLETLFETEVGTIPTTNELNEKKQTLRVLTLKRDTIAAEIGHRIQDTISTYPLWIMDQVNFDDPRLADIKDSYFNVEEKIKSLTWEVSRLQAIHDGELPRHEAKVKVYSFLRNMNDENAIAFLQTYHLSTTTLTEAVLLCPRLLEDLTNFEENIELIRSCKEVWW